jgi:type 1 fimbria pilin
MMKKIATLLILTGLALPQSVFAACMPLTAQDVTDIRNGTLQPDGAGSSRSAAILSSITVNMPGTVEVDPDAALLDVIATGTGSLSTGTTYIYKCEGSGTALTSIKGLTHTNSDQYIYDTNVPGIGLRLTYIRASGASSKVPYPNDFPGSDKPTSYISFNGGAKYQVELIKTGPIASLATVNAYSQFGTLTPQSGASVLNISSTSTTIKVLPKCSVNASTLNVDFGTFGPREVSTTDGPTRPVSFQAKCSGPTAPTSITATLAATPDTTNPNLIQNDSAGAKNLGIQLKETATGTILKPNDANSKIAHASSAQMDSAFDLQATVLRAGSATPTVGKINATATITLTIL